MSVECIHFLISFRDESTGLMTISVIDLQSDMSYERDDWTTVDGENYSTASEAIHAAKSHAKDMGFKYSLFESRYGNDSEEDLVAGCPNCGFQQ